MKRLFCTALVLVFLSTHAFAWENEQAEGNRAVSDRGHVFVSVVRCEREKERGHRYGTFVGVSAGDSGERARSVSTGHAQDAGFSAPECVQSAYTIDGRGVCRSAN